MRKAVPTQLCLWPLSGDLQSLLRPLGAFVLKTTTSATTTTSTTQATTTTTTVHDDDGLVMASTKMVITAMCLRSRSAADSPQRWPEALAGLHRQRQVHDGRPR